MYVTRGVQCERALTVGRFRGGDRPVPEELAATGSYRRHDRSPTAGRLPFR